MYEPSIRAPCCFSSPSRFFPVRVRVRVRVRKRLGGDVILWKAIITTQRYFGSVRVRVRVRKLLGGDAGRRLSLHNDILALLPYLISLFNFLI